MVGLTSPLRRLLGQSTQPAKGTRRAQVLSVCARKGGVGKTTTAVSIASGLALNYGKKVLLVDVDAQGHCSSALRNCIAGVSTETLSSVLLGRKRDVSEIALSTKIPGLWVTAADKDLNHTEGILSGRIGKEFLLKRCMETARTLFDFIVIDCPPNLGNLTVNALSASDWALIPCDMSTLALEGVDDIFEMLEALADNLGHHVAILGVLRTRFDTRNQKVNDAVNPILLKRYGRELLDTKIPVNTQLAQSQVVGEPIYTVSKTCKGARAYTELMREIEGRLGLPKKC
jgi:chromosome partitioning protein